VANDGSEHEFTGSGREFTTRSRSPLGDVTGHAVVDGLHGTMTMTMPVFGRVHCKIQIAPDHKSMIVTVTMHGISAQTRFDRVSWPSADDDDDDDDDFDPIANDDDDDDFDPFKDDELAPAVAEALEDFEEAVSTGAFDRAEEALMRALEAAGETETPEDDLIAMVKLGSMSCNGVRLSDGTVRAYLGAVEVLSAGGAAPRLVPHLVLLGSLVPDYGLGGELDPKLVRAGHAVLGKNLPPAQALEVVLVTAGAQDRSGDSDGATRLLANARRVHGDVTSRLRIARVEAKALFDRQRYPEAFDELANAIRAAWQAAPPLVVAQAVTQLLGMWPRQAPGIDEWINLLRGVADRIGEPRRSIALAEAIDLLANIGRKPEARALAQHCNFDRIVAGAPPSAREAVAATIATLRKALADGP
jgi:hypothetical protein